jgi:hypothetical protein
MSNPWDRRDGESDAAYGAFLAYRDLGLGRTVLDAFRQREGKGGAKQANGRWNKWVKSHEWHDRARAWDAHLAAERQAGIDAAARESGIDWEAERQRAVRDKLEFSAVLLSKARVGVERMRDQLIDARDLKDFAATATAAQSMEWDAITKGLGTVEAAEQAEQRPNRLGIADVDDRYPEHPFDQGRAG